MNKKIPLFIALLFGAIQLIVAQTSQVKGTVSDEEGSLPGVSVLVKGTLQGTETDFDGNYNLNVKKGDVLVFSFVGYKTVEIPVNNRSEINVLMSEESDILDEIVVVAYSTVKKSSYTGSVSKIKAEEINERPITNAINALDGAIAGVKITPSSGQPGSSGSIRIRGIGSINASSSPLIILDGAQFVGSLSSINPNDIESMTVLKDAASTALYGSRAANGVIMITTKKGKKGVDEFSLDISQGITSRGVKEYDRVNAHQYYPLMWEALRNGFVTSGVPMTQASQDATDQIFDNLGINPFNVPNNQIVLNDGSLNPNATLLYAEDLDWQKPLVRSGLRTNYNFSYSGASEKTDYFLSLGYLNEDGYVIKADFERLTARLNMNTKFSDWFKTGINISGATSKANNSNAGGSSSLVNPFRTTRYIAPIYPVHAHNPSTGAYLLNDNGVRMYDIGVNRIGSSSGRHVIQETLLNRDISKITSLAGRAYAEFTFLNDFTFTFNGSFDRRNFYGEEYDNPIVGDAFGVGRAGRDIDVRTTKTFNQLLKYNKDFGKHSVGILLGHESFETDRSFSTISKEGQVVEGNYELINFTTTNDADSFSRRLTREGYFSNVTYDFNDKYYLSGSIRRDGSSRFSDGAKWGNFFSVGASWKLNEEEFIKNISWIDFLKLRGSYGEVGNDVIGSFYASQALFGLGLNNGPAPGILTSEAGNPDLTWETNIQSDIALEFGFFNNILNGTVEYYNRESKDLLFNVPLPVSGGLDDFPSNVGSMTNRGLEVDLNIKIFNKEEFKWNFNINGSTIENEITELPQEEIINGTKKLIVGGDIYQYFLRRWYGVDPNDGAALFILDSNQGDVGDPDVRTTTNGTIVTTNQNKALRDFAGSAIPDLFGAFTNTIQFKDFELGFTFTYQLGGKTYDSNYASLMHSGQYGTALHTDILRRWQNPGDITDVPRLDASMTSVFGAGSDRWLVNSDFLALRNASLTYNIPSEIVEKVGLKRAKILLFGENLFLLNERNGLEPSQNFNGTTSNRFSPSRVYSLGVNLTF